MLNPTSSGGTAADGVAGSRLSHPPANDVTPVASARDADSIGTMAFGITVEALKAAMHAAGYRVEIHTAGGMSILRSATGGLGFEIRLKNRLPPSPDRYLDVYIDVAFVAMLAVQGAFPQHLVNDWNKSHRFGRVYLDRMDTHQEFLVLCMDAVPAAGPKTQNLRAHIDIWDALVHQLIAWLNKELQQRAANAPAAPADSSLAPLPGADRTAPTT